MCGIVAYIGQSSAVDFLIDGLRRLEYRGYDSSGIATIKPQGGLAVTKKSGRIDQLTAALVESPVEGSIGIGHTRWATHGPATDENAHPHVASSRSVAIVHNGVIENYRTIKDKLIADGAKFISATDSEVIAELVAKEVDKIALDTSTPDPYEPLVAAVQKALASVHGTYGLVVLFRDWPNVLVAARLGSPLVIGVGDKGHYIASDGGPLVGYTDKIVYLKDHEIAVITRENIRVIHRDQGHVSHNVETLAVDAQEVELDGFDHYMLKEIYEQPEALRNTMRGRLCRDEATAKLGGLNLSPQQLRSIDRILLTACGTSWHAALVGEYIIESISRLPVEVEYASELRYRNPPLTPGTLLFALTQSGETADTLAALKELKRKGHSVLSICNVVGSTIAQAADGGVYLHAGPEIGVASTKAFTSQCTVMALLALHFGRLRHLSYEDGTRIIDELEALPDAVEAALLTDSPAKKIAEKYAGCNNFLYLGRQFNFPTALEGALKLKEISYIHAEGYPAAEMKHGPIALVDEHTPSVFIVPKGTVYEKVMSNLEEVKARGGPVIAIVNDGDTQVEQIADDVIYVPNVPDYLQPIVTVIPLQFLAYHIACKRGCDVDKPRNLAKSVTVE